MGALTYNAVVLAGGRSSRLGGVDKARLLYDGATLLQRTLAAVGGAAETVVVGPFTAAELPPEIRCAREDPPFAGPVAAIAAGLAALKTPAELTAVLACDMPHAGHVIEPLLAAAQRAGSDGVMARTPDGRLQPLAAFYRTAALTEAVQSAQASGAAEGMSVFRLIASLQVAPVDVTASATHDVDTWDDVHSLGVRPPVELTAAAEPRQHKEK